METKSLIENLASDLKNPSDSRHWFTQYWFSWVSCFSLMAILTYIAAALLPNDIHLPHVKSIAFWLESSIWFFVALLSAVIAYRSSLPGKLNPIYGRIAYSLSIVLMISLFFRWSPDAFAKEFFGELHLTQGPCGMFIGITGLFAAAWMFFILRRAAPIRLGFTAAWSAASVGALGSMFMHLVCTHESSVHVFIWHMMPLMILIGISSSLSQKLLRW